ncbi:MAG: ATP-grasp domain-containing protein [Planctomycetes bacterium]|nr:ATP-grasp domain-containing protein [Planctomycetota bacterium]
MGNVSPQPDSLTVLFTCVGRRIELVQAFRAAARRLGVKLRTVAVDSVPTAPGLFCVDTPVVVPPVSDPGYIDAVADVARRYQANVLVPTIDTDLRALADHRDAFAADGCLPLIAEPHVIHICRDKIETFRFLRQHGMDTPVTYTPEEVTAFESHTFPYFLKPRYGSASVWVHKINDQLDLDYYLQRVHEPIVQEFVDGVEHTLDAYVGLTGTVRCVVPRARREVRSGEVSKGVAVKNPEIMQAGKRVVEALGPSVRGVVTLQCIVTAERRIRFIEINPRFGGGAPLAIAAGADFPAWLLQELRGEQPKIEFDGFRHGLSMLRYDWSVFVPLEPDLKPRLAPPLRGCPPFE